MEESGVQGNRLDCKNSCVEGLDVEKVTEVLGIDELAQRPDIKGHMKRILGWVWEHPTLNDWVEDSKCWRR